MNIYSVHFIFFYLSAVLGENEKKEKSNFSNIDSKKALKNIPR